MATEEIRQHWARVVEHGCIITQQPAEIAHCHGGSISDELPPSFRPGVAQKQSDWLVLPLCPRLHRLGPNSLDGGSVREWEATWGTQMDFLRELSGRLGYDVFERAGLTDPAQPYPQRMCMFR
jgi:hypothetical protein